MKIKYWGAIGLFLMLAYFTLRIVTNLYEANKEQSKKIESWQKGYERLNRKYDTLSFKYDSLSFKYDSLLIEFERADSAFCLRLRNNILKYEKIIAGYDTLGMDDHIRILSKHLSKEDHF